MTHLYLVRHGEAVVNVEPIIGGIKGDTGLTPRGVQQAESLYERLSLSKEITPDVVIASTLPRARQTAELVAPAFGLPIVWDEEVQEIHVGEADGMYHNEAWKKYGSPHFEFDPYRPISPGGESWADFMLRVGRAIHRIITTHQDKTIMVITHGGFIDGSFAYFLNIHTRGPQRLEFYPHNTSLTHWEQYHYHEKRIWRLVCYNDITHLRRVGVKESPRWANVDAEETTE